MFKPRDYHFDHIVPRSKGGTNSLDNLGIACRYANMAKNNLSVKELLELCADILEYNGYEVLPRKVISEGSGDDFESHTHL